MLLPIPLLLASLASSPQDLFVETRRMLPKLDDPGPGHLAADAGDVTGDGWADVVIVGEGYDFLLRSDGHALFQRADKLPSGFVATTAVALADYDGDGDLDAYLSQNDGGSPLLDNQGGELVFSHDVPGAGGGVTEAETGDLDGDGDPDLVLARHGGEDRVFLNQGGTLVLSPGLSPPAVWSEDVELADLDGDGDLDVAIAAAASGAITHVYLNDGAGAFTDHPSAGLGRATGLSVADVDADGNVDLYHAFTTSELVFGDGTGAFVSVGFTVGGYLDDALLRDVNGDGAIDLFGFGFYVSLFLGTPGGLGFTDVTDTHVPVNDNVIAVAEADLDGDSDADLLAVTDLTPPLLWLNDGGVLVETQTAIPYRTDSQLSVAIGDVNGDGAPDAYCGEQQGPNALYLGDAGQWTDGSAGLPAAATNAMVTHLADLDGDGSLDVLSSGLGPGWAVVGTNDGTGVFTEVVGAMPIGSSKSGGFASGDVDGDGDIDVVTVRDVAVPSTHVLINDGSAVFTDTLNFFHSPFEQPNTPVLFDGDLDGDLDLITSGKSTAHYYVGDGVGGFVEAPSSVPSAPNTALALADVDADGDFDAYVARSPSDELWRNTGGVFQVDPAFQAPPEITYSFAFGDVDGDGDADLVVSAPSNGRVLANDGTGAFTLGGTFDELFVDLEPVDLDGDGDLDLVGTDGLRTLELTNVAGGQVARRTPARLDKSLRMEIFGPADAPWVLAVSTGTADLALPPFGTLAIDPAQLWVLVQGQIPPDGLAGVQVPLGPDPTLLGVKFHWQSLVGAPLAFTNREATTVTSL